MNLIIITLSFGFISDIFRAVSNLKVPRKEKVAGEKTVTSSDSKLP